MRSYKSEKIKKDVFEKLIDEGYGATSIACFFGISKNTLCTWTKQNYEGKTVKQIYAERWLNNGKTEN